MGNEGGGRKFKAASEFDSQHDFVALFKLKWGLSATCFVVDLEAAMVIPRSRGFGFLCFPYRPSKR